MAKAAERNTSTYDYAAHQYLKATVRVRTLATRRTSQQKCLDLTLETRLRVRHGSNTVFGFDLIEIAGSLWWQLLGHRCQGARKFWNRKPQNAIIGQTVESWTGLGAWAIGCRQCL